MDELATRHAAEPVPPEDGRADGPATADGAPEPWGALGPLAEPARRAARALAAATSAVKDAALRGWADALEARVPEIVGANTVDMDRARAGGVSAAILDRLLIDEPRTGQMADGLRQVAALKDPVGIVLDGWTLPNGLRVEKVRVPLGVVGVIYEGRPNVTVDAAGLGVKAGNAVLLRGSRVAERSNAVLVQILQDASEAAGLPAAAVQSVPPTRESARDMMRARGLIDLLIPRGGADLIETTVRESHVPVIETGVGNCHVYVDAAADLDKALAILVNAKVQRPGVCNAAETFLVHRTVADAFVPRALEAMAANGVDVFGDEAVRALDRTGRVEPATEDEYRAEFLDLKIAARVVGSLDEAIEHISTFGTKHTEAIVTEDYDAARRFVDGVDAAAVMVNASTRFTDGGEFGMGAEVGISTQKLHARGPMALPELTTYKFVVYGTGQIRA
ncbi:MAG TPA: glutamate-5-semialdehyde dehydrogenase [Actinomycetota bacterium]|nr:glutamate-5-semialdehyde dehydrogenase [Actinomycetota bacterium]